jgi:hypothetical protein
VRIRSLSGRPSNGDGQADLAVVNGDDNQCQPKFVLGKCQRTFQTGRELRVEVSLTAIAISTLTGWKSGSRRRQVRTATIWSVLLETANVTVPAYGECTVTQSEPFPLRWRFQWSPRPGELAVANYESNSTACCWETVMSTFQAAVNYEVDKKPYSVTIGDFNGDGMPTLVSGQFGKQ